MVRVNVAAKDRHRIKARDFNRWQQLLDAMEARELIPRRSAQKFLELKQVGKIPAWALRDVDLDAIQSAAE